jgi:hypothetical protein
MDNQRNGPSTQWTINAMDHQLNGQSTQCHRQDIALSINATGNQRSVTISTLHQSELQVLLQYNNQRSGQSTTQWTIKAASPSAHCSNQNCRFCYDTTVNAMANQRSVTVGTLH